MFILALDGGGIRGAYSARLLQRLELSFPTFITAAHLVAGTLTAHKACALTQVPQLEGWK
jgi:patatin-like phospholipase/acyl hydrolase